MWESKKNLAVSKTLTKIFLWERSPFIFALCSQPDGQAEVRLGSEMRITPGHMSSPLSLNPVFHLFPKSIFTVLAVVIKGCVCVRVCAPTRAVFLPALAFLLIFPLPACESSNHPLLGPSFHLFIHDSSHRSPPTFILEYILHIKHCACDFVEAICNGSPNSLPPVVHALVLSPPSVNLGLSIWPTEFDRSDHVRFWSLGFKGYCVFHLVSLDLLLWGSQSPCCEDLWAVSWRGPCDEGLRHLLILKLSAR